MSINTTATWRHHEKTEDDYNQDSYPKRLQQFHIHERYCYAGRYLYKQLLKKIFKTDSAGIHLKKTNKKVKEVKVILSNNISNFHNTMIYTARYEAMYKSCSIYYFGNYSRTEIFYIFYIFKANDSLDIARDIRTRIKTPPKKDLKLAKKNSIISFQ